MLQIAHFRQRRRHVHFGGGPNSPWLFIRCKSHTGKLGGAKTNPSLDMQKLFIWLKKNQLYLPWSKMCPLPEKKKMILISLLCYRILSSLLWISPFCVTILSFKLYIWLNTISLGGMVAVAHPQQKYVHTPPPLYKIIFTPVSGCLKHLCYF